MTSYKDHLIGGVSSVLRPLVATKPWPSEVKKVLVLKPCCLGDVVLATPTLAALQTRLPNATIDVAVGSWSRSVLNNNPRIKHLIDSGTVGQGAYNIADVRHLAKLLRANHYDLAITLDRSPLVGLIPWLAGIPHRVGLDSRGRGFAHTYRVPVPTDPIHEAELYLRTVPHNPAKVWAEFYPSPADSETVTQLLPSPFVILHSAGGRNPGMELLDKRWPLPRFVTLARRLIAAGYHIVLSGVAADRPLAQQIANQIDDPAVHVLAGDLSLGEFGALCRRAAFFVGGDTGATHIAAAVGAKTIAIFGPSDPNRYAPFAPPTQVKTLWHPTPLPPDGVSQGSALQFSWTQGVSVDDVWQAAKELTG